MTGRALLPPTGGDEAPHYSAALPGGLVLDLQALAGRICEQYREEFPDELQRYGPAGHAWCIHDNQHLLNWSVEAIVNDLDINQEVAWLANLLADRNFPTDRLARSLDIGAAVVREEVAAEPGTELAAVLADTARFVRTGEFVDYLMQED